MIIRITYPSIYNVDIRELNNAKRNSVSEGKKTTDEYIVDSIEKITLHIVLSNRKERYKIRVLKSDWFHPVYPSLVSCDVKLNEQFIEVDLKRPHNNSELELELETDYVKNSVNSYSDKLKLNIVRTKMAYIVRVSYFPASKQSLISLICVLILTFLLNISVPLILAVYMIYDYFYQPDLLWGIEEKYLIIGFVLLILIVVHFIRFIHNVQLSE